MNSTPTASKIAAEFSPRSTIVIKRSTVSPAARACSIALSELPPVAGTDLGDLGDRHKVYNLSFEFPRFYATNLVNRVEKRVEITLVHYCT